MIDIFVRSESSHARAAMKGLICKFSTLEDRICNWLRRSINVEYLFTHLFFHGSKRKYLLPMSILQRRVICMSRR